jgi:hypothetical protein
MPQKNKLWLIHFLLLHIRSKDIVNLRSWLNCQAGLMLLKEIEFTSEQIDLDDAPSWQ